LFLKLHKPTLRSTHLNFSKKSQLFDTLARIFAFFELDRVTISPNLFIYIVILDLQDRL